MLLQLFPVRHPHNEPPKWSRENIHFPCHRCAPDRLLRVRNPSISFHTWANQFKEGSANELLDQYGEVWRLILSQSDYINRLVSVTSALRRTLYRIASLISEWRPQVTAFNNPLCWRIKSELVKGWLMKIWSAFFSPSLGTLAEITPAFHSNQQQRLSRTETCSAMPGYRHLR